MYHDLLSLLLNTPHDEKGNPIKDEEIKDNIAMYLLASKLPVLPFLWHSSICSLIHIACKRLLKVKDMAINQFHSICPLSNIR
jgi:hypothetical protein